VGDLLEADDDVRVDDGKEGEEDTVTDEVEDSESLTDVSSSTKELVKGLLSSSSREDDVVTGVEGDGNEDTITGAAINLLLASVNVVREGDDTSWKEVSK
jgi:hypothetical protein